MKENPFKRAITSHKQTTESVAEEVAPTGLREVNRRFADGRSEYSGGVSPKDNSVRWLRFDEGVK